MSLEYNRKNIPLAKNLRRNATPQENHLWYDFLAKYEIRFQRQKAIDGFIADFYCHKAKLVIELDGSQHYEKENGKSDFVRDSKLKSEDIKVLRYTNLQIKNEFENVCKDILRNMTPHPSATQTPSPQGEG